MSDWTKIKAEYLAGGTSYRKLAKKYGVKLSSLRGYAERENWVALKAQTQHKVNTKLTDSVSDNEAKKTVDIISVADKLLEKIGAIAATVADPDSIKKLTSAIKDLRDVKGIKSEADMREQEARIRNLEKLAQAEEKDSNEIKVVIEGNLEGYSK